MSAYKTTAPSSANVIRLNPPPLANTPKAATPTFQQAREAWLDRWHFDHRLSDADRAFCTQLYLHFNRLHYEATGELMAWPSWETLRAKAGRLTKSAAFRRLRHLEQLGAVEIEHGRYDHKAKQRARNRYRAVGAYQGCIAATLLRDYQGCTPDTIKAAPVQPTKVAALQQDSLSRDSLNRDSLNKDSKRANGSLATLPDGSLARPQGQEKEESEEGSKVTSSNSNKSFVPINPLRTSAQSPSLARDVEERRAAEATLEKYRRRAAAVGTVLDDGGDQ
jgi:hypothetical protein